MTSILQMARDTCSGSIRLFSERGHGMGGYAYWQFVSVCVAVCCSVLHCFALCCSALQCVTVYCSVLQCIAVCCSVLQCVAAPLTCAYVCVCVCVTPQTTTGIGFDVSWPLLRLSRCVWDCVKWCMCCHYSCPWPLVRASWLLSMQSE